jgi:hypothetical protein
MRRFTDSTRQLQCARVATTGYSICGLYLEPGDWLRLRHEARGLRTASSLDAVEVEVELSTDDS